jgi:outer membrane protein assembly factor BamB
MKVGTSRLVLAALIVGPLAGCASSGLELPSLPKLSDITNSFKEKTPPLPGRRISIMPQKDKLAGELADAGAPIALPAERVNDTWSQPGGEATNSPGHLALSGGVRQSWTASAGDGSSKTGRVTASPIVSDGRVYTLDASGVVSAFSLGGGSPVWRASLAPTPDANKPAKAFKIDNIFSLGGGPDGGGYGGGIAADGGRIFAASGFGTLIALDPASGKRIWEKNLGAPVRSSPTASGERVFVVTTEGRLVCVSAVDGTELWVGRGLPQAANLALNPSPAVDGDIVVAPFPSGDIMAFKITDGTPAWTENLSRTRSTSQIASMSDAARPVIDNGVVFAAGHGGRMVATNVKTGERMWQANVASTQAPWVAGDTVFVVDTGGQVMALARQDGRIRWTAKLPGSNTWSGPTLANNTLWLVSNKGQLVGVEAATGKVGTQVAVGGPTYIAPVVAQGKMFVLTDAAQLVAMN